MAPRVKALAPSDYHELTYSITRLLAENQSLQDSIPVVLQLLGEKLGCDLVNWWTVDDYKLVLKFTNTWQAGNDFPNFLKVSRAREFSVGEGLPGTAWASRHPVWFTDVRKEANFPRASVAQMDGLCTGVAFALRGASSPVGVIEFFTREQVMPEGALMDFLSALGGQIGVFVERSRALEQVKHLDAQLQHVSEGAADAIFTIDESSTILFANSAVERILGYKPHELVGRELTAIIPPRLRDLHKAGIARYLATGKRNLSWEGITLPGLHKDGREVLLEISFAEFRRFSRRVFTGFIREAQAALHLKTAPRRGP
jgi:PAS domain S-box-containing protein